jgi:tetratricopeptide (TPR) repeat protein
MWYVHHLSSEAKVGFPSPGNELIQATSRNLILAVSGIYMAFVVATGVDPGNQFTINVWVILPFVLFPGILAFKLLSTRFLVAQLIWQAGLAVAIMLEVYVSQQPEVALLCAFLPLLAVLTLGWQAGLLAEGLVVGLGEFYMTTGEDELAIEYYKKALAVNPETPSAIDALKRPNASE